MNSKDAWETIYKQRDLSVYPSEHVIRFVAHNYYNKDRANTACLDFGCGSGAHLMYLYKEGFDAYGFDISETVVKRLLEKNSDLNLKIANGVQKIYPDNFFDFIIDNLSIQANYLCDIRIMYENCYSYLKPGGKLLTVGFGRQTSGYGSGIYVEDGTYEDLSEGGSCKLGPRHFWNKNEIITCLTAVGFTNVMVDYVESSHGSIINYIYVVQAEK